MTSWRSQIRVLHRALETLAHKDLRKVAVGIFLGGGNGRSAEAAAERITGTGCAVDIEKQMIEATRTRLPKSGRLNVQVEQRDFLAHGCGRSDASVVFATLFNILHIEEPVELFREARRVLVPGGKVGIIY